MNNTDCFDNENLSIYALGGGSDKWRQSVAAHIEGCPKCRQELAGLEAVEGILAQAPIHDAPDQWSSIAARLEPRATGWRAWPLLARPKALAAAAGLVVVATLAGLQFGNAPAPMPSPAVQQQAEAHASEIELAQSHMALTWNEPFADSASLAVVAENGSKIE